MIRKIIISVSLFLVCYSVIAQNKKVSLSFEDLPLPAILDSITRQTGYYFSYNSEIIPDGSLFTLSRSEVPLQDYLNEILTGTNIKYTFYEDQIILKKDSKLSVFEKGDTFTIEGWVREKESKGPLASVNIYLNETTIGTASLDDGSYKIENVPIGSYTIVFSHVGFHKVTYDFTVDRTGKMVINSLMEIDITQLEDVAIESRPLVSERDALRMMEVFTDELLGTSYNAGKCKILNDEVISFSYDPIKQIMQAYAEKPIKIENKALGYLINYDLELFESSNEKIRSLANIQFTEMEPKNEKELKRWQENREKAYQGSFRHFLKSMIEDDYYPEGFRVYSVESRSQIREKNLTPVRRKKMIFSTEDPLEYRLDFEDYLFIVYNKEIESLAYLDDVKEELLKNKGISLDKYIYEDNHKPESQKSLVRIVKEPVIVDINGHIIEPLSVSLSGYWAWEKLADMVPIDYRLKSNSFD